ncbi:hypothetical protein SODG_005832 [Sodalis praecaptivus]
MKMPNMANGRDGFPCALNPVGDIFQPGTPPFKTEASIALGRPAKKRRFWLGRLPIALLHSIHFVEKCVFGRECLKTCTTCTK